jgi:hypothetical protein
MGSSIQRGAGMRRCNEIWTGFEIETAKQMNSEGMRPKQIADRLGKTKSAVIGKLARLGVALKNARKPRDKQEPLAKGQTRTAAPVLARKPYTAPRFAQALPELPASIEGGSPSHLLNATGCRWIVGEARGMIVCNRPSDGGSWCHEHRRVVFVRK